MKEKSDCCPFCNKETLYANPKVGCDNPKCECHKTPPMDLAAGKKIDDSDELAPRDLGRTREDFRSHGEREIRT